MRAIVLTVEINRGRITDRLGRNIALSCLRCHREQWSRVMTACVYCACVFAHYTNLHVADVSEIRLCFVDDGSDEDARFFE